MKKLLVGLMTLWCAAANAQPVQQSGNVTPGHSACFAISGVIYDCGSPGGGVSVVGSTTTNDFVAFNASGSLIDSGINPANTSAISGLWNFNGGATAPTRPNGDNTTNIATTAFVSTALTFSGGITTNHGTIGNVNSIWTNDGAIANRLSDRLFVGAAAIVNGGNVPESPKDWLETLFAGATQNSQMTAFSTLGLTGAAFASRASDWPTAAQASNSIGAAFYGFADNTTGTLLHGAWGGYGECDKSASVNANCFALELDAANYGAVVDITPSAMFPSAGTTVNLQNGCGGVNGGTASCTAVMTILSNTQKFRKGIVFGAVSLDTILGTGGGGVAIEMGGGTTAGQSIRWLDASGNLVTEIYGVVATNPFTHFNGGTNGQFSFDINGVAFLGLNSTNVFPNNTNTVSLGATSLRWATINSVLGNYSGLITASGGTTVSGTLTLPDAATWTSGGLSALTAVSGTFSGQLRLTYGTPTIASGACGTGTNGTVAGSNQAGLVTVGASSTTTCTVSFSTTLANAPSACSVTQSAGTAELTKVTSISTSAFVIAGATMASTSYYYICI